MADITCTTFNIIQAYAGKKEAYFTATVTATDVLKFTSNNVSGAVLVDITKLSDGSKILAPISGTNDNEVIIPSGPSATPVAGRILYRSY